MACFEISTVALGYERASHLSHLVSTIMMEAFQQRKDVGIWMDWPSVDIVSRLIFRLTMTGLISELEPLARAR